MFRFSRSTIRLAASTLLVVFVSALLGPVVALAGAAPREHVHLPGMPQAHHHHEDEHRPESAARVGHHRTTKPAHPHRAYAGADEQQLTSLTPLVVKLLTAPSVLTFPAAVSFLFGAAGVWDRQQAVVLVPPAHLKPKIPDLRIFLGSLVI
ncbi:hypothetical protein [Hymenobacter chitinivorans]|uniref:Uncharacterized protein n=1 Tax=Hymenobacter chitinivorans DSM 11115 TaxID=1121954 RepID=A0A2M9BSR0_9BACT|nr:hypothetical protein [Hymenobacter chitinivorans]PJJ60961.1 hypothetical protein CLV45_2398 [Hymenobacter chitinivorans DSM 11115]